MGGGVNRPSSALRRWSSTQVLLDYWGTFCAGSLPKVLFSLLPLMGIKPWCNLNKMYRRLSDHPVTPPPPRHLYFIIELTIEHLMDTVLLNNNCHSCCPYACWVYYQIFNVMPYSNTALGTTLLVMYDSNLLFYVVPLSHGSANFINIYYIS